jgi:chorismate synthase
MSSSFGSIFKIHTFGESHGPAVGVVIDGCPPRLPITTKEIQFDLDRRRPGQSRLVTQRDEEDSVEILSGWKDGLTLGTPIALLVRNKDHVSGAYDHLKDLYRPSHADFTTDKKYGIRAHEGGGRSSARETIGRVAAGAIARKLILESSQIEVLAWVHQIHEISGSYENADIGLDDVESSPTRCPDPMAASAMVEAIEKARKDGDSLGGIICCRVTNVPVGLGDPVFAKLEAELAKAMLSLPASKGFDIGSGFSSADLTGSEHNDEFILSESGEITTATNYSGGIQGGISNGENINFRVAFKPTATIASAQNTVSTSGEEIEVKAKGRHDPCVLPRAVPMVEAMASLVLGDALLRQATVDYL